MKTKSFYPIICIIAVTHGYLYQQLGINHTEWINVCLIYLTLFFVLISKKMINDFKSYYFIILLYIVFASSLGSYGSFMHTAHWLKTYPLGFLLLFTIIHKPFKNHIFVEKLFLFLWLIQFFIVFSWTLGISILPNTRVEQGTWSDYAIGTLGYHLPLGDFMVFGICYYLPEYFERKNKKILVMLIVFLWVFIQTSNRHLLLFLPLVLGIQTFMYYVRNGMVLRKSFSLLSFIIILCFSVIAGTKYYFSNQKELTFNVSVNETSELVGDVVNDMIIFSSKTSAYRSSYNYMVDSNILRIIMGYGPATFGSGTAEGIGGPLYEIVLKRFHGLRTDRGGSVSLSDTITNDFIAFGTEFGILGIIVLYSFFIYIMIFSYKKSKRLNNYKIEMNRILGIILYVMLIGTFRDFIPMGPFIIACILIGFNLNKLITYTTTIVDENDNKSILN